MSRVCIRRSKIDSDYIRNSGTKSFEITPFDPINPLKFNAIVKSHESINVNIELEPEYPFRPPRIFFHPIPSHPNITSDGYLCETLLLTGWSPQCTLLDVLEVVQCVFDTCEHKN